MADVVIDMPEFSPSLRELGMPLDPVDRGFYPGDCVVFCLGASQGWVLVPLGLNTHIVSATCDRKIERLMVLRPNLTHGHTL